MDVIEQLNRSLVGRYRIDRRLGSGGMATVYLADDLRHDRQVALKVLKPELAAVIGSDRFLAEIGVTAKLQHPNILPLFDSGEADGTLYYVMPYVAGESLRDRLDRERELPVDEAVRIASDVADALQAAHEQGIVHRDVKPANILLSRGRPLVADFGIALAVRSAGGGRLTETGLSLGTPTYVSPEQATADRDPGPTSDVYSLGCVLYEMLVGRPPYVASSAQALLAKILTETPDAVSASRPAVPANVDAAVRKALERTPADRFRSATAFRDALANGAFRHHEPAPRARVPAVRSPAVWGVGAGALVAGLLIGGMIPPAGDRTLPVVRYSPDLPLDQEPSQSFSPSLAVSRDGSRIVYVGPAENGNRLWVLERDRLGARPLPGTEGAIQPFLSPDGTRAGFIDPEVGALRVVSLGGGAPLTIVDSGVLAASADWAQDGYIYFDSDAPVGLMRVRAAGGSAPEVVHDQTVPEDVLAHWAPQSLPGGRGLLLTIQRNHENDLIVVMDKESGSYHVLVEGQIARYSPTGHLVYLEPDGSLLAVPFDVDAMEVTGPSFLLEEIGAGSADLALSDDGRLVYTVSATPVNEVVWVDRQGVETPLDPVGPVRGIRFVALSPDESRLAVNTYPAPPRDDGQIWIKELPRGPFSRLTFEGDVNFRPEWFPDGRSLAFISDRGGSRDIWVTRADGTVPPRLLQDDSLPIDEVRITRDGRWMTYRRGMQNGQRDIYARPLDSDEGAFPLIETGFDEFAQALSPDGRWMAYGSDMDGGLEVYVRPFPTGSEQWRVSKNGGRGPVWARDGSELYYRNDADSMAAVAFAPGDPPTFGEERALFSTGPYRTDHFHRSYDVTRDGRFVMIRYAEPGDPHRELVIVENWLAELRALGTG